MNGGAVPEGSPPPLWLIIIAGPRLMPRPTSVSPTPDTNRCYSGDGNSAVVRARSPGLTEAAPSGRPRVTWYAAWGGSTPPLRHPRDLIPLDDPSTDALGFSRSKLPTIGRLKYNWPVAAARPPWSCGFPTQRLPLICTRDARLVERPIGASTILTDYLGHRLGSPLFYRISSHSNSNPPLFVPGLALYHTGSRYLDFFLWCVLESCH